MEIGSYSQGAKSCQSQWSQRTGQAGCTRLKPSQDQALAVHVSSLRLYSRGASHRVENLDSTQETIAIFSDLSGKLG